MYTQTNRCTHRDTDANMHIEQSHTYSLTDSFILADR